MSKVVYDDLDAFVAADKRERQAAFNQVVGLARD